MGPIIDRAALTLISSAALWLVFMGAFGNIFISAFLTFTSVACLRKLSRLIPWNRMGSRRRARAHAAKALENIALSDASEARRQIAEILRKSYPADSETYALSVILRHPSGAPINPDDILREWKARKSSSRLIIASPAKSSKESASFAQSLKNPMVRLLDGPTLVSLIAAQSPNPPKDPKPLKRSLKERFSALHAAASRARPGKCTLTGLLMTLLFFLTGSPAYLSAGLVLFFIAAIAFKNRAAPKTLFP